MPTEKNIKTPDKLFDLFIEYGEDCKNSPRKENFYNTRLEKQVSIDREKPMTWDGFEIWLRNHKIICRLEDYKANRDDRYTQYVDIIHVIGKMIYEDKYTGAVAGIYQNNIIARDLGLQDKQVIDIGTSKKDLKDIFPSDEELNEQKDK